MELSDGYPAWVYRSASIRRWALWAPTISFCIWLLLASVLLDQIIELPLQVFWVVYPMAALIVVWMGTKLARFEDIFKQGEERAAQADLHFSRYLKPGFLIFPFRQPDLS